MSYNLIKLKKVLNRVKFAANHIIINTRNMKSSIDSVPVKKSTSFSASKKKSLKQHFSKSPQKQSYLKEDIKNKIAKAPSEVKVSLNEKLNQTRRSQNTKITKEIFEIPLRVSKNPSLKFRKITEDIINISNEIDLFIKDKQSKGIIQEHVRKSITPPAGYKITKQSFPDISFQLPRVESGAFH